MNWDQVAGNWKQFTGKVKEQWGDLTGDELEKAQNRRRLFMVNGTIRSFL